MESTGTDQPAPRWFTAAAIAALLWEIVGSVKYLMDVSTSRAALPIDQRVMWEAMPIWMLASYAVAVWVGLVGAILLLRRRRLAEPLLLISLVAVIVQFSALLLVPELRNLTSSDDLFVPTVIIALCTITYQFARTARKAGWLR